MEDSVTEFEFDQYLTRKEAAAILRCSITTLKRLEKAKELHVVQLTPNSYGYRAADFKRYLHERTKGRPQ